MNQSEFKANTSNRRQARENMFERGTIGFGFTSHWLRHSIKPHSQDLILQATFSECELKTIINIYLLSNYY